MNEFQEAGEFGQNPTPTGSNEPAFESQEEPGQIPAQFVTVLPFLTTEQQARLAGLQAGRTTMWFECALTGQRSRELPLVAFSINGKTFMEQAAYVTGCGGWLTAYIKPNDGGENEDFYFGFEAPMVGNLPGQQQQGGAFGEVERIVRLMKLLQPDANPMASMAQNMTVMMGMFGMMQKMAGQFAPKQEDGTDFAALLKIAELGKGVLFGDKTGNTVSGQLGGEGGSGNADGLDTSGLVPAA